MGAGRMYYRPSEVEYTLGSKTIEDMKQYGFSPLRPELAGQIQPGDMIVAGKILAAAPQESRRRR